MVINFYVMCILPQFLKIRKVKNTKNVNVKKMLRITKVRKSHKVIASKY